MPSFGILASLTTLALAAFTSAAPAPGGPHHEADVANFGAVLGGAVQNLNAGNLHQGRNVPKVHISPSTIAGRDLSAAEAALVTATVNNVNAGNVNQDRRDVVDADALIVADANLHGRSLPDFSVLGPASALAATLTSLHASKGVARRDCNSGCRSLPVILADVTAQITPSCNKLSVLAAADVSVEVIAPICKEMSSIILSATAEIKLLIGQPLEQSLYISGKVLAVADVARLVADLLCLIFGALCAVFKVVATVKISVILPLLTAVGLLVADLCTTIFLAVHGIAPLVVGLICKIIPALFHLKLYAFIGVLGL